jgi:hypothetical protein
MTELYHQLGHQFGWSLSSIAEDGTGDGVIIAPRYMSRDVVVGLSNELKKGAIFDPQFYIPDSQRGKLRSYDFFPQVVADGFETGGWNRDMALKCATGCITFQFENDFRYTVIPTRYVDGMPGDYIESQSRIFVDPFLEAYEKAGAVKPCLLQLILTDQMIKEGTYQRDILNWVTGISQFSGVYLIYSFHRTHKQIDDMDFLLGVDHFVRSLKQAGMVVVMGYLNAESVPLLCADPDIMTTGSYENLRIFGITAFVEEQADARHPGPNPRMYVSRLLQWVEYEYLGAIERVVGDLSGFLDYSDYRAAIFDDSYKWHFTKPEPYKHYFVAFSEQFRRLAAFSGLDRLAAVKKECEDALTVYSQLEEKVVFDADSGGRHLPRWLTFLNQR